MEDWEINLSLGREELIFLLRLMDLQTVLGLEEEPLSCLSKAQREAAMTTAKHSLLARGIIQHPGGAPKEVEVDAIAAGLVTSGLRARASITASRARPGGTVITRYYHFLSLDPYLVVEHGSPEAGVHTFQMTGRPEAVLQRLSGLLNLQEQGTPAGEGGEVAEGTLLQARQTAAEGGKISLVEAILRKDGLDEETTRGLGLALCQLLSESSLIRVDFEMVIEEGIGLLEGPDGLWLLQRGGSPPNLVKVAPVSPATVRSLLQRWVECPNRLESTEG